MPTIIIDGTGESDDAEYARSMQHSFCSQIARQIPAGAGRYLRGPTLLGSETSRIADAALDALAGCGDDGPVRLVGYSRGACASLLTAQRLRERGVRVESVFLFDAVDMQLSDAAMVQIMPDNIDYVAHARTARDVVFWIENPIKSRWYFYNTGRWLAGDGVREEASFTGSHGAAGGVPWPDVDGDAECARAVAEWMNQRLEKRGIAARLTA
ncbi:MAG: thioesterase domain-containing protein [Gemmatimonadota bacterium]|nr:thioesterase domain-containing protein [Gemmatimonadota bacterium]